MPLFRKRSQLDNAAAIAAPLPPQETTVNHNYAPSRALDILAWFVVIVIGAVLIWHGLVFLAGQANYPQPERAVVNCLMGLGIILALLAGLGLASRYFLADYYRHRETMEELHLQALEKRARLAQAISPQLAPGMLEEDKRRYRAVTMAMARAYQAVDEKGRLRTKGEPWSKRGIGELVLLGETRKIGEDSDLAKWVKPFLLERAILLDDRTVNLARFPDLASVEAALVAEFGRPVMRFKPGENDSPMSGHWIERGTDRESWG